MLRGVERGDKQVCAIIDRLMMRYGDSKANSLCWVLNFQLTPTAARLNKSEMEIIDHEYESMVSSGAG
jgi:hypothetical protein